MADSGNQQPVALKGDMTVELKVPAVGESITEVEIGEWFKSEGDSVNKDENVVALESEKATVELPSPATGTLKIVKRRGEKAVVGEVIGLIEPVVKAAAEKAPEPPREMPEAPRAEVPKPPEEPAVAEAPKAEPPRREKVLAKARTGAVPPQRERAPLEEEVVPMTPLRRAVAERLVEARQTMAMLTTFNEVDLSAVMALRKELQERFKEKHGVKLGFMSFFIKATIEALKQIPQLNASIRGADIVYHNYFDIGIAVSSGKGLVVPVLKGADRMSFAETEKAIGDFGTRAQENKLKPDELQAGTFTITNGGVFGSLLSTPIVNPPQCGILGMHAVQERPVAVEGNVVIRPMMYVALSYDHRLVDGREAVLFLRRVKELVENPARIMLEA